MKIGFQVEGTIDRVVLPAIVSCVLDREIEAFTLRKRVGGVNEVFKTLTAFVWSAWRNDCTAAVVHADSDDTRPHDSHAAASDPTCRHCAIRDATPKTPGKFNEGFFVAIAVPVKELEAWLIPSLVRTAGPPQLMPRRKAKKTLWGTLNPDRATVEAVCREVMPRFSSEFQQRLAHEQPSFESFRTQLSSLA